MLQQISRMTKDVLFPIHCFSCGVEGTCLCDPCLSAIPMSGVFCCSTAKALNAEIAVTEYSEGCALGRMVWAYKYHYAGEVGDVLGKIAARFVLSRAALFEKCDAIVPIPLHPRRFAERGFNQAEVLSRSLSETLGLPIKKFLKRRRYTVPQARLSRDERRKNVDAAFAPADEANLNGTRIILVDDIYTTGSTMQSAAKSLKASGAGDIVGFTLARAL